MSPVLVPIYDGSISKALVDSGALTILIETGYPVVLIVEERKVKYYQDRFGTKGYRVIPHPVIPRPDWLVRLQIIGIGAIPTRMMLLRHLRRMMERKKYVLGFLRLCVWALGHFFPTRWILQHLVVLHSIPQSVRDLIDADPLALIFCPTLLTIEEIDLVRYGKKKGIPVIGMIKTWDNITTKLSLPVSPDHLMVHTDLVRDEAVHYLHYPRSQISVVGLPQFDRYRDPTLMESQAIFFERMKLQPNVPMLLYCAAGLWMSPDEPEILMRLNEDIERGVFGPLQVLVRMHPKYDCGAEHLKNQKHLILDRPGTYVAGDLTTWEYEDHDLMHLISSLRHAAVTSNTASTMSVEAAYFDKPVINIGFDPKPTSWIMSNARYYEREHYRPIVHSHGVRVAYSYEEFVHDIKTYLAHPEMDHEGRETIVREQCIGRDFASAQSLGHALLGYLEGNRPFIPRV